ncbi:MAG: septum formation initiator family protein, partial [Pauljensenia sp.]
MPDSRSARPARPKPPRHPHVAGAGARAGSSRDSQRSDAAGTRRKAAGAGTGSAVEGGDARPSATDPAADSASTRGASSHGSTARAGSNSSAPSSSSPASSSGSTSPKSAYTAEHTDPAGRRRRPRTAASAATRTNAARRPANGRRTPSPAGQRAPKEGSSHPTLSFGGLTISVRLLGIAVVGAVLAGMLVPSLFQWWRQEQDLRDITARVAAAEQQNADMQHQLDLWNDPDYIASQARSRLGYVLPGETQYAVVDPGPDHADTSQIDAAEP